MDVMLSIGNIKSAIEIMVIGRESMVTNLLNQHNP